MVSTLNFTHDPGRRSWVESANAADTDFPIQNLPLGLFRRNQGVPRGGVAIGNRIFDLREGLAAGLFSGEAELAAHLAAGLSLNPLLAVGCAPASALRAQLSDLLRADSLQRGKLEPMADRLLVPIAEAEMLLPVSVTQYTDMCASTFHIGRCRGEGEYNPTLVPVVMKQLPVGYNGRASSVVVSGTAVRRPNGQWKRGIEDSTAWFGPEPSLDYELEMGMWIGGPGNRMGEPIGIAGAQQHIFGFCLLNDWSARSIQMFESMLGPFLGKSLATTISPWVVTAEALAPFRVAAFRRPPKDPGIANYLLDANDQQSGGYDIELRALVRSARMRARSQAPMQICQTNFRHMYWTWAQMLTHHASNGCNLGAGDLIGSGTCSGPTATSAACLLESTNRGRRNWRLPTGEKRLYLEDGDEVVFRARASSPDYVAIGFGDCSGTIVSSVASAGNP
jgi:fumarylacetoacetase